MNNINLTVVITASHIPSHPSIEIIKKTINSLKYISRNQNFNIILAHDFFSNINYTKYLDNLKNEVKYNKKITIEVRKTHGHLTGNIRNIIHLVKTKYVLIAQHDLPFVKEFEIMKIIDDMESNLDLKCVRFNKRSNVKTGWDKKNNLFGLTIKAKNYCYIRTPAWSDNNHLCLKSYYNDIVLKECKDGDAMENTLNRKITTKKSHKKYGTYIFGNINDPPVISHLDGKKYKIIDNNNYLEYIFE